MEPTKEIRSNKLVHDVTTVHNFTKILRETSVMLYKV